MAVGTQLRKFGSDTLMYGLGNLLQGAISFLLFPIYARVLTSVEFGIQELILSFTAIATSLMLFGLDSSSARFYFDAQTSQEKKDVISTWLSIEILLSLPITILLVLFSRPFSQIVYQDALLAPYFSLGALTIPLSLMAMVFSLVLRLNYRPSRYNLMLLSGALTQAVVAILMVVVFHKGIQGVLWAMIISGLVQVLMGIAMTRGQLGLRISKPLLTPMLRYGLPLLPTSIALWVMNYSNRYFLNNYVGLAELGYYGIAVKIATLVSFAVSAFLKSWAIFGFDLYSRDKELARQTYRQTLTHYLLISGVLVTGLGVFSEDLIRVLATKAYLSVSSLIPVLAFSAVLWGVVDIVGIGYFLVRKSYYTTIATLLGAGVAILANWLLIPLLGIYGAGLSILFGNIVIVIFAFVAGQKHFRVAYEYRKLVGILIFSGLAIFSAQLFTTAASDWSLWKFGLRCLIFLAFLASLLVTRILPLANITQWLSKTLLPRFKDRQLPK